MQVLMSKAPAAMSSSPEVRDSTVEITSGYARVGGTLAAWVAVGVGAAVVLAAVIIYIRRREAPGA